MNVCKLRLLAALCFLALMAGCAGGGGGEDAQVLRIAYLPISHSAAVMMLPHVVGEDSDFAVELVRFTTWPEVAEALLSGHVDGASILFEVAVTAFLMDAPIGVVSLSHRDGNVLVVDNTVQDIHCLVGRTVAIPHAHSPHYTLLGKVLAEAGLSFDDINLVEISPAEMPFSMAARAISAYVVAEPWGSIAEQRGAGRILVDSRDAIPDSVCCLFVLNSDLVSENPGLLEWIKATFALASAAAHLGDETVIEVFRQFTGFDRYVVYRSLANTNFHNLAFTQEDFDKTIEYVLRYGLLTDFPAFSDFSLCCLDE